MTAAKIEALVWATMRASLPPGAHLGPIAHGWTTPEPTTCSLCALSAAVAQAICWIEKNK